MTRSLNTESGDKVIKFLYSYGGKILPRRMDGKLCYAGGHTRVLAVDRSISFAELMVKLGELTGSSMSLKCKLPSEDLDVLVSITNDEDLANVIGEYDRFSSSTQTETKIRAILFPIKSLKQVSPPVTPVTPVSPDSTLNFSAPKQFAVAGLPSKPLRKAVTVPCGYGYGGGRISPAVGFPVGVRKDAEKVWSHPSFAQGRATHAYYSNQLNHWQSKGYKIY